MAPDIPKIDPDRHPNLGDAAWNFRDEVLRWLFHGNSLSDLRDLLIPFFGNYKSSEATETPNLLKMRLCRHFEGHTSGKPVIR